MTVTDLASLSGRELDAEVAVACFGWQRHLTECNDEQYAIAPPDWDDWSESYWLGKDVRHLVPAYSSLDGPLSPMLAWLDARRCRLECVYEAGEWRCDEASAAVNDRWWNLSDRLTGKSVNEVVARLCVLIAAKETT